MNLPSKTRLQRKQTKVQVQKKYETLRNKHFLMVFQCNTIEMTNGFFLNFCNPKLIHINCNNTKASVNKFQTNNDVISYNLWQRCSIKKWYQVFLQDNPAMLPLHYIPV